MILAAPPAAPGSAAGSAAACEPDAAATSCIEVEPQPEGLRVRLAANPQTAPALLQHFGEDASITVRAALALNPAAPADLDRLLARDTDERVRALLGRKLALLLPQLAETEREFGAPSPTR